MTLILVIEREIFWLFSAWCCALKNVRRFDNFGRMLKSRVFLELLNIYANYLQNKTLATPIILKPQQKGWLSYCTKNAYIFQRLRFFSSLFYCWILYFFDKISCPFLKLLKPIRSSVSRVIEKLSSIPEIKVIWPIESHSSISLYFIFWENI